MLMVWHASSNFLGFWLLEIKTDVLPFWLDFRLSWMWIMTRIGLTWSGIMVEASSWLRVVTRVSNWLRIVTRVSSWLGIVTRISYWLRIITKISRWLRIMTGISSWLRIRSSFRPTLIWIVSDFRSNLLDFLSNIWSASMGMLLIILSSCRSWFCPSTNNLF